MDELPALWVLFLFFFYSLSETLSPLIVAKSSQISAESAKASLGSCFPAGVDCESKPKPLQERFPIWGTGVGGRCCARGALAPQKITVPISAWTRSSAQPHPGDSPCPVACPRAPSQEPSHNELPSLARGGEPWGPARLLLRGPTAAGRAVNGVSVPQHAARAKRCKEEAAALRRPGGGPQRVPCAATPSRPLLAPAVPPAAASVPVPAPRGLQGSGLENWKPCWEQRLQPGKLLM